VKVNAPVDEDVAPLVAALNEFPGAWTTQSCRGKEHGFVFFRFGQSAAEAAEFLVWIGPHLVGESASLDAAVLRGAT
jgi:hypothetical protein